MAAQLIDKEWFFGKLQQNNKSVRGLGRHLDLDASAVSRMLSGKRKMQLEEANSIASFLGVNVNEVLKHSGMSMDGAGSQARIVLAATIDEKGTLQRMPSSRHLPQSVMDRANIAIGNSTNGRVIAAQVRASGGPLSLWDDAVILFQHTDTVDPGAIGCLSICRGKDGNQVLGKVVKSRKTGEATIMGADGKLTEILMETATPVMAILP